MQASDLVRAVAAAGSVASSLGLTVDDAVVVNDSNNLASRLPPCDVLARVAPVGQQVEIVLAHGRGQTVAVTRLFVVLSGLPASGKTTLGRRLAPELGLPLLDKDDILSPLLAALEVGDPVTRHRLSRGADAVLHQLAAGSAGAVISSFWRRPQLSDTSGTPTDWLDSLPDSVVVEVFCQCPPQLAARRFSERSRHPGHGDADKNTIDLIEQFTAWTAPGPLHTGRAVVTVHTSHPIDARSIAASVRELSRL